MAVEAAPAVAPIATYGKTDEQFYATRYKQGGRTVYLLALTPGEIIANILRPNPDKPNPGNRRIRLAHAQSFARYYLEHDNWVIPGIILRAPDIFDFDATITTPDDSARLGVVSYPKRKQGDIQILDGQHRILGFHLALEMLEADRQKAIDHLQRARKVEEKGSRVIKEADHEVREIERKQERFYQERIAVEIQVTDDMNAYRQMFFDIADNALGITASVKARFDTRKVVNRALALVTEHPLLVGRVDPENDRLGRTSPYLLSARHVTEIIRSSNVGIEGRVGRVQERELSEVDVANKATGFLDLLMRAFPQFQAVEQGVLLPDRLRQISMLGSPLFLRILAGTYHELRTNHAWSDKQVQAFFEVLGKHLEVPLHENTIWLKLTPEDTFNIGGYGPNGRRQDIVNTSRAIWDWAVLGEKGYPAVYADPEPAPEPEPAGDETEIDYSDLDDPALAKRLQHEDIDLGIAKKPARKPRAPKTA